MNVYFYVNKNNLNIITQHQTTEDVVLSFVGENATIDVCVYDFVKGEVLKGSSGLFKNGFVTINKDTTISKNDLSAITVDNPNDTYICYRDGRASASTSSKVILA